MVEQNDPKVILEPWGDMTPHVLVTAEPMGEDHRLTVHPPRDRDVVPLRHTHVLRLPDTASWQENDVPNLPPRQGHHASPELLDIESPCH